MSKTGVIMRDELLSYMDVTPGGETPTFKLIGEGFNELTESLNPVTKESTYIHQKNKSSSVTGYAPEFTFSGENFIGDPVADYVASIGRDRKTGSAAETDIVNVCCFEQGKTAGTYRADKQHIAIKVDQVNGGTGVESMPMTGSFLYKGDPVKGSWDPKALTFTADGEESPAEGV